MAAFSEKEIQECQTIWNLFCHGSVMLFRSSQLWQQTIGLLQERSYRTVIVDCSQCADESSLLFGIVDGLQIPRYLRINLDSFNDFMRRIDFGNATGVIICLNAFDPFHTRFPNTGKLLLDILSETHRRSILVGNRFATIVRSDDPNIDQLLGKIGGITPAWNSQEWKNSDRQ